MVGQSKKQISLPKISFGRFSQIFFTLKEALGLSYRIDPKLLITVLLLNAVRGLTVVPSFYIDKLLIDNLVSSIGNSDTFLLVRIVFFLLFLRFLLEFFRNALSSFLSYLRYMFSRKVTNQLDILIGEKISSLPLSTIEDPDFRDKFNKIERESGRRVWGLMMPISNIPNYLLGLVSSVGLFLLLSPYVVLGVIVFSLPTIMIDKKFIKKDYELHTKLSPLYRIWEWLSYYLSRNRNFMEMKVLGLSKYLAFKLRGLQDDEFKERVNLEKERQKSRLLSLFPSSIFDFLVTLWMAYLVVLRKLTVGSFQMFLRALSNVSQNFTGLASSLLEVYENYIYMVDLVWFLNLKPDLEDVEPNKSAVGKIESVEFKNVWFKYRDDLNWVIKGVDIKIKKGEKIAVVGENGAGKSTLIKLLGSFYTPQKGEVLINGKSLKEVDRSSLWRKMAVLFQDFELYPFSAREAIGFGDIERMSDQKGLKNTAEKAGISEFIESLPLKYENPIAPEFEKGVKPSIGQWQRFGIARMLFRKSADIFILDEPTSNVDPEAEEEIFTELSKITKDKILIFITQRFSTVRIADRILVVGGGKIIEEGTHKELMKKNGKYARMFNVQARAYHEVTR